MKIVRSTVSLAGILMLACSSVHAETGTASGPRYNGSQNTQSGSKIGADMSQGSSSTGTNSRGTATGSYDSNRGTRNPDRMDQDSQNRNANTMLGSESNGDRFGDRSLKTEPSTTDRGNRAANGNTVQGSGQGQNSPNLNSTMNR